MHHQPQQTVTYLTLAPFQAPFFLKKCRGACATRVQKVATVLKTGEGAAQDTTSVHDVHMYVT